MLETVLSSVLILAAAILYSAVGHAGASGYLAVMALFGVAPAVMKPAALVLNILVACIATIRFYRAGRFAWRIFTPLAAASAPFAFLGGVITLPGGVYRPLVGVALLWAAFRLLTTAAASHAQPIRPVPVAPAVGLGAAIGLLSGLTGVGGGIFLSPVLLFLRWADAGVVAGVSAAFILVNSVAGVAGQWATRAPFPPAIGWWAAAAVVGGLIGSKVGARRLGDVALRRVLGVVLIIAGVKLMWP